MLYIGTILFDPDVSLSAKGLFSLILRMKENGTHITSDSIREHCKEGRDSFHSAIKELKKYGYLEVVRVDHAGNRGAEYDYRLYLKRNHKEPIEIEVEEREV